MSGEESHQKRVLQIVPAQPDTWLAHVFEIAFGKKDRDRRVGWQSSVVSAYEVSAVAVDCWALVDTIDRDGEPAQEIIPLCMAWTLTAQDDGDLVDIATRQRREEITFDAERDRRQTQRVLVVRAQTVEEACKLAEQQIPPSGPVRTVVGGSGNERPNRP
jgi:hypothetical protein